MIIRENHDPSREPSQEKTPLSATPPNEARSEKMTDDSTKIMDSVLSTEQKTATEGKKEQNTRVSLSWKQHVFALFFHSSINVCPDEPVHLIIPVITKSNFMNSF